MRSLMLAATAAVAMVAGTVAGSETVPAAKPTIGAPLMFHIDGAFRTVPVWNGPWSASSTGKEATACIRDGRFFPAGSYLYASHEGQSVVFRWEAKGLDGGKPGWYAYSGEEKASAPQNTPVVVTTGPCVASVDSVCSTGYPVQVEANQSNVVYTTVCNGSTCSQVPVTQFADPVIYGGESTSSGIVTEPAPAVQNCPNGRCHLNGQAPAFSFPYEFYSK